MPDRAGIKDIYFAGNNFFRDEFKDSLNPSAFEIERIE